MALPSAAPGLGESRPAAAGARRRAEISRAAVLASFVRRRSASFSAEVGDEPTEQLTFAKHVLQSDFANTVESPSGGYVECEIVFDGNTIRIYAPS